MTKTMIVSGMIVLALVDRHGLYAQSGGTSYCMALVQKYEQYLDMDSKRGRQPQSVDARAAVEKCKAGDASGVPTLEKALQDGWLKAHLDAAATDDLTKKMAWIRKKFSSQATAGAATVPVIPFVLAMVGAGTTRYLEAVRSVALMVILLGVAMPRVWPRRAQA